LLLHPTSGAAERLMATVAMMVTIMMVAMIKDEHSWVSKS
jgi:hypothetical protein